ncbi:MAG: acetate--CoA ligase family protein [Promethearchaeota archaeon]
MSDIDFFFNPKSIAIIGASDTPRFGFTTTKYLLESQFKTYPVNLKKDTILGHKTYKNIKDIPDDIELAIVLVAAQFVLQIVKDCIDKGVLGIIIESAGFAETREEKYIHIQNELIEIIKNSGIRVIGPNCVGLTNFNNRFTSSDVDFDENSLDGGVSVIAQSGVLGNVYLDWSNAQKIGFSKVITLGNKLDVDEVDLLQYLNSDPNTKVITLYLEDTRRGRELKSVLKHMTKPVVVLKNGRSEIGKNAVKSHTASIAGNDLIYEALFKQIPTVFRVDNFYEMFNIAGIFAKQPLPKGKNIAVITGSGSLGALTCDEIAHQGMKLANLSEKTMEKIKSIIPDWVAIKGTIDLGPSMFQTLIPSLEPIMSDDNVDSLLFIFSVPRGPLQKSNYTVEPYFKEMGNLVKKYDKPCVCVSFGSRWVFDFVLESAFPNHIPVVERVRDAIKGLKIMSEYSMYLNR